jgi:hypothetical protein
LFSALIFLIGAGVIVGFAEANPSWAPLVNLVSPENNRIYYTSNVELKFVGPHLPHLQNLIYILDNQTPVTINSSEIMINNLSAGNHKLALYGAYYSGNDVLAVAILAFIIRHQF